MMLRQNFEFVLRGLDGHNAAIENWTRGETRAA